MDPGVPQKSFKLSIVDYTNLGSQFLNKKLSFCTIIIKTLTVVLNFQVHFYAFSLQLHEARTFF